MTLALSISIAVTFLVGFFTGRKRDTAVVHEVNQTLYSVLKQRKR